MSQTVAPAVVAMLLASSVASALSAQKPDTLSDTAALRLPAVEVIGQVDGLSRVPGSGLVLGRMALQAPRPATLTEVLRLAPGLNVRDEEGLALRPNIGIRGLSPTRSTTVLLLEDGVPFTLAPYGDNASYYHPAFERFDRVEVLKGSGQILFGPRTVGGVINYVTPAIPLEPAGRVELTGGGRDYTNGRLRFGGTWNGAGLMVDVGRKHAAGARDNVSSTLLDGTVKASLNLGARQSLVLKGGFHRERSQVTYSGLTESEWAADPYQNPFRNDSMLLDRTGFAATHRAELGGATLTTAGYAYTITRHWWRQSSNSAERPNDASDPNCADMANLNTTCGNQGRLRAYQVVGVEPRLRTDFAGGRQQLDAGIRLHYEQQDREQVNGAFPTARTVGPATDVNSGIAEDNLRTNTAVSAFAQHRVMAGRWGVTAGLRVEHVGFERINRRPTSSDPQGVRGTTSLTELIPGVGVTYLARQGVTVFAGAHRGFAPPRTEDIINNNTGDVVELDAEKSWNYELGLRSRVGGGLSVEATAFAMDFANQIIPASVAGGTGATLTSAGETMHQGIELALDASTRGQWGWRHDLSLTVAYTWLPLAEFRGERFAFIGTGGSDVVGKVYADQNAGGTRSPVSVTGRRLPYAPRDLVTAALGWAPPAGPELRVEAVRIGEQYGDPVNTVITVPDGQQGVLPAVTLWNVAATWFVPALRVTLFGSVKNVSDEVYIADRTRGLLPGGPRWAQLGISHSF
ncbi:MAG TPA: TonB-dependent receptor [Gemmatimonadales bacterium]|nr:TonB-dependent receptor [Gemmatimonadales bacterium]